MALLERSFAGCHGEMPQSPAGCGAPAHAHLQRAQQRRVEVQRQQSVDDLHGILLEDEAAVEVRRYGLHLRPAPTARIATLRI